GGGGGGGGSGALGATLLHADGAARAAARLWMLRVVRDGLLTSQDLGLSARKQVIPLLLQHFDAADGSGGGAAERNLIFDVIERLSDLHVSGARYLLNRVGFLAWARVQLAKGVEGASSPFGGGADGGGGGDHNGEGTRICSGDPLPLPLTCRLLRLLSSLLASGLALRTVPRLLIEEYSSLVPLVVVAAERAAAEATRAAAAAATAAATGGTAVSSRGRRQRRGRGGHWAANGGDLDDARQFVQAAVSLLSDVNRAVATGAAATAAAPESERHAAGVDAWRGSSVQCAGGIELCVGQAHSLTSAVDTVVAGGETVTELCALLCSPGAVSLLLQVAADGALATSAAAVAAAWVRDAEEVVLWCIRQAGEEQQGHGPAGLVESLLTGSVRGGGGGSADGHGGDRDSGDGGPNSSARRALGAALLTAPVVLHRLLAAAGSTEAIYSVRQRVCVVLMMLWRGGAAAAAGRDRAAPQEQLLAALVPALWRAARPAHLPASVSRDGVTSAALSVDLGSDDGAAEAWIVRAALNLLMRAMALLGETFTGTSSPGAAVAVAGVPAAVTAAAGWMQALIEGIPAGLQRTDAAVEFRRAVAEALSSF
ncbi:unnamed protein product, partial [Phaeothamnion confervicola]